MDKVPPSLQMRKLKPRGEINLSVALSYMGIKMWQRREMLWQRLQRMGWWVHWPGNREASRNPDFPLAQTGWASNLIKPKFYRICSQAYCLDWKMRHQWGWTSSYWLVATHWDRACAPRYQSWCQCIPREGHQEGEMLTWMSQEHLVQECVSYPRKQGKLARAANLGPAHLPPLPCT